MFVVCSILIQWEDHCTLSRSLMIPPARVLQCIQLETNTQVIFLIEPNYMRKKCKNSNIQSTVTYEVLFRLGSFKNQRTACSVNFYDVYSISIELSGKGYFSCDVWSTLQRKMTRWREKRVQLGSHRQLSRQQDLIFGLDFAFAAFLHNWGIPLGCAKKKSSLKS